jgi:hypothetical protein
MRQFSSRHPPVKLATYLLLLTSASLAPGCAASVSRIGYTPPPAQLAASETAEPDGGACPVLVTADTAAVAGGTLLGQIRYRDSGFSTRCDEATALRLFQADACALDADVALITSERGPNLWSTCYRAEAAFYRVPDSTALADVRDRRDPNLLLVNRGAGSGQQALWLVGFGVGLAGSAILTDLLFGGD